MSTDQPPSPDHIATYSTHQTGDDLDLRPRFKWAVIDHDDLIHYSRLERIVLHVYGLAIELGLA